MFCAIWYHLYNLKNVKNTHGGVLLLVKLQTFYQHTGKVGLGTWDPYLGPRNGDPSPGTKDLGPHMWDPIQGTNTWDQSKKTHLVYQSPVFRIVLILIYSLEFTSQFLIIAK